MTITTTRSTTSSIAPRRMPAEFTVGYRQLSEAVRATAVAAKSKVLPVLGRVLVDSDQDGARLTTFNFDTAITVELDGATERTRGRMLIEHAVFTRVLAAAGKGSTKRHLDELEVRLDVIDGVPTVHVDGYAVPVEAVITPDQFPALPPTTPATHVLDRVAFTDLFERCRSAADRGGHPSDPDGGQARLGGRRLRGDRDRPLPPGDGVGSRSRGTGSRPSWRRRTPSPRSFII